MTTCNNCEFNSILNHFITGFDGDGMSDPIIECPNCGSDDCVKDAFA